MDYYSALLLRLANGRLLHKIEVVEADCLEVVVFIADLGLPEL
jgi:hypothetical protein